MDECVSCGTRVEDGLTQCPHCSAKLTRPGTFLQVFGWVVACISLIPLAVGVVTFSQKNYAPLVVGGGLVACGVAMIVIGRKRMASVPDPTRPSAPVTVPPLSEKTEKASPPRFGGTSPAAPL